MQCTSSLGVHFELVSEVAQHTVATEGLLKSAKEPQVFIPPDKQARHEDLLDILIVDRVIPRTSESRVNFIKFNYL